MAMCACYGHLAGGVRPTGLVILGLWVSHQSQAGGGNTDRPSDIWSMGTSLESGSASDRLVNN